MEQHPIPRQITTFEFKLIGFMTVKQFIYLIIFIPLGFVIFKLFPLPLLNIILGFIVGFIGVALAFFPYNERPLDHWISVLWKKLNSPTQYFYHKNNQPLYFLENLYFLSNPHLTLTHIESKEKLAAYLAQKNQSQKKESLKKKQISQLLQTPLRDVSSSSQPQPLSKTQLASTTSFSLPTKPFLYGFVKSNKLFPIPGILIYIKDKNGKTLRLLKTNNKGLFATFKPLPEDEYYFETKDPTNNHFFDTMKLKINLENPHPIEIFSQKIL